MDALDIALQSTFRVGWTEAILRALDEIECVAKDHPDDLHTALICTLLHTRIAELARLIVDYRDARPVVVPFPGRMQ